MTTKALQFLLGTINLFHLPSLPNFSCFLVNSYYFGLDRICLFRIIVLHDISWFMHWKHYNILYIYSSSLRMVSLSNQYEKLYVTRHMISDILLYKFFFLNIYIYIIYAGNGHFHLYIRFYRTKLLRETISYPLIFNFEPINLDLNTEKGVEHFSLWLKITF